MNTMAPSKTRIAAMIAFAASCVALLLFLWLSFGGLVPFVPQGYRISVELHQAVQPGTAGGCGDCRGDGRQGGQRRARSPDRADARGAADRSQVRAAAGDTRATLREKTLLGETYVELSFGTRVGRCCATARSCRRHMCADRPARPDPRHVRSADAPSLPDVDAGGRNRFHQPRTGVQRRARRAVPVRDNVGSVLDVLRRDSTATARCCPTAVRCCRRSARTRASCRA